MITGVSFELRRPNVLDPEQVVWLMKCDSTLDGGFAIETADPDMAFKLHWLSKRLRRETDATLSVSDEAVEAYRKALPEEDPDERAQRLFDAYQEERFTSDDEK